ncbi:hypothetical protein H0X48_03985 [Candidatus Dependentiae bacterium]|nr:hypothetical protein [Candidatus Dependentiae bacterium]
MKKILYTLLRSVYFFMSTIIVAVNFNKTKETQFLFKNTTPDTYIFTVKKDNTLQKIALKPQSSLILTQDKDHLIQQLTINSVLKSPQKAYLQVIADQDNKPTYSIQDKAYPFDQFQVNFATSLNATGDYYKDAINGIEKNYPGNISTHWYKASLPNGVTPAAFIDFTRALYTKYFPLDSPEKAIKPDKVTRIPKKLHQIWIGPKPVPEEYKKYQAAWRSLHPNWQYKLWTNADVINFPWSNPQIKAVFTKATNYATKADILRIEILNAFGGVYVDLDTEPLEPLDSLTHTFDFFGLLYGPDKGTLVVDVFFLGATAGHPIIQETLKNIVRFADNPPNLSHLTKDKNFASIVTHAVMPLTHAVWQKADKTGKRDIILPLIYFSNYTITPFSYGVHYPKRSWLYT